MCHWCLSSCYPGARAQRELVRVSQCVGSLRGTAWDSRSFIHQLNCRWFLQPDVMGTHLPGIGTLGCGVWCEAGTPCSQDIPPSFLSTIRGCRNNPFHVSAPPTSLDGCGFFNSVVVRPPVNLIADDRKWWLFHSLVVTLMCLHTEASHVYLCCHLDSKFYSFNLISFNLSIQIFWFFLI